MLTSEEVAAMAAEIAASLPEDCTVMRPTRVSDGAGGFTETSTPVVTTRCRVSPSGQDMLELAARRSVSASWSITLPAGTNLRESDRIECKGRVWEVAFLIEYPYDFAVYGMCREVR